MSDKNNQFPRIWLRDINRRRYNRDENNRSYGSPIERHYWYEVKVTSETSRSWITEHGKKIPKKGSNACFSEEEIDRRVYVSDNRHQISDKIRKCGYEELRKIANIIGHVEVSL